MRIERVFISGSVVTHAAFKGFLPSVASHVDLHIAFCDTSVRTHRAFERLFTRVFVFEMIIKADPALCGVATYVAYMRAGDHAGVSFSQCVLLECVDGRAAVRAQRAAVRLVFCP